MKRFVITGASTYGVKNAGDDAMLANLVQGLRRNFPDCIITFLARHLDSAYDAEFGFHSLKNLDHDTKEQSRGRWFLGFNQGDDTTHLQVIRRELEAADLLILGGNSFMEIADNNFLRGVTSYVAHLAVLAKFCGTPFSLYGLAVVDEIRNAQTRDMARFLCANAELITVREPSSRNYLEPIGADVSRLQVLADPAYGMKPVPIRDPGGKILCQEGIELGRGPVIGFNYRVEYWHDQDRHEHAMDQAALLCERLVGDYGADLLMIPNCTYTLAHPLQDDRVVHRAIRERCAVTDRLHVVQGDYPVQTLLQLFPLLDAHVSNRRHSCVFAAIHGIPFITLGVSLDGHIRPFAEQLGMDTQRVTAGGDTEQILSVFAATWSNRAELSRQLRERTAELHILAHRHVDLIAELLNG
uniref:Polysaccharide pyruvyl transferase family protein WcaK n=1 Tax=Candidatus Kentrum sp. DK TaxID=2126562 RepID=A0A450T6G4_9GAMM|nr:MAG: Polysaccharide pyruvyl transferase family protein WcaK [Candidatus Kentron sp. DK]